jgi:DNA-binding protein YbaB
MSSIRSRNGVLTIIVGVKGNGDGLPSRLKVDPDVKVFLMSGDEPEERTAKEVFTDKLRAGTKVKITLDGDKKITKIEVGGKKKGS